MTGLYILIGILAFFALVLSLKANVIIDFDEELRVTLRILCFNIQIAPSKGKKPVKIKDYTFKNHQKRLRKNYSNYLKKQQKKEEKKKRKAESKAAKKEKKKAEKGQPKKPTRSVLDWIDIARAVIGALFSRFAKSLHIKVARLKIKVATGDAASTAILYGAVIQSVAYIIEILQRITNVDGLTKADISVDPDYLSESTSIDLCFVFSLRVWHVFNILFGTIGKAIKKFFETSPDKKKSSVPSPQAPTTTKKKRKKPSKAKSKIENN